MKKVVLIIGLVIVLVGSALGGMAFYANASTPPILNVVSGSSAPGLVQVVGSNWVPGVAVDLWMDTQDDAHHVFVAKAANNGVLMAAFSIGPTKLGVHNIIAVQNATTVSASFTLTSVQQVDDRINNVLQNNVYGLPEIKEEVKSIETQVHNLQTSLDKTAKFIGSSGGIGFAQPENNMMVLQQHYDAVNHVSLTLYVKNWSAGDTLYLTVSIGGELVWLPLTPIVGNAGLLSQAFTFQFDTTYWFLSATIDGGQPTAWVTWDFSFISFAY